MVITVNINTIRNLRTAHGLDQERAAARCGISQRYWNELEAGKHRGSPKKTWQIADAFSLLVARLVLIK